MQRARTNDRESRGCLVVQGYARARESTFENLEDGATTDDFLTWFPGVHDQVRAVLEFAEQSLAVS